MTVALPRRRCLIVEQIETEFEAEAEERRVQEAILAAIEAARRVAARTAALLAAAQPGLGWDGTPRRGRQTWTSSGS